MSKLRKLARKVNNAREWVWEYAARKNDIPKDLDNAVEQLDEALELIEEMVDDELSKRGTVS